jgi:hypothetical protein
MLPVWPLVPMTVNFIKYSLLVKKWWFGAEVWAAHEPPLRGNPKKESLVGAIRDVPNASTARQLVRAIRQTQAPPNNS